MERREQKKHDLRDDIYPPLPGGEKETSDPIAETEQPQPGDLPLLTPDSRIPDGQTTRG